MSLLRRIQEKDSGAKARYAFAGATIVTGLIALVWASTLPARFSGVVSLDGEDAEALDAFEESTQEIGSAVTNTKSQLGNLIQGVREESQQMKEEENTTYDTIVNDEVTPSETVIENEHEPVVQEPVPVEKKEEEVILPTPEPRVILIGTTTSQITE